jgi:hypothetical protein
MRPERHDHPIKIVNHCLAVVTPLRRIGGAHLHDPGIRICEILLAPRLTTPDVFSILCSSLLASVLFAASIAVSISASGYRFYCRLAQPKSIVVLIK